MAGAVVSTAGAIEIIHMVTLRVEQMEVTIMEAILTTGGKTITGLPRSTKKTRTMHEIKCSEITNVHARTFNPVNRRDYFILYNQVFSTYSVQTAPSHIASQPVFHSYLAR